MLFCATCGTYQTNHLSSLPFYPHPLVANLENRGKTVTYASKPPKQGKQGGKTVRNSSDDVKLLACDKCRQVFYTAGPETNLVSQVIGPYDFVHCDEVCQQQTFNS